jgi:hypothetical protein
MIVRFTNVNATQLLNVGALLTEAFVPYLPHISLLFGIVLYEGLLGGAAYANTFNAVHKTVRRPVGPIEMTILNY